MKINDYIIKGGENLNDPARKTNGVSEKAEALFDEWRSRLGQDDRERENYLEIPVDGGVRLFIRAFWHEEPGNRPVCWYIGILLPKQLYTSVSEYYLINRGLINLKLNTVLSAVKTFSPIEINTVWQCPKSAIGKLYDELRNFKKYGDDYEQNMIEMCASISINSIDDWFERLFIAVNPYRLHERYDIVVSRKEPRRVMFTAKEEASESIEEAQTKNIPKVNLKLPTSIFRNCKFLIFLVLVFITGISLVKSNRLARKNEGWEKEKQKLVSEKNELKKEVHNLKDEINYKDEEINNKKSEINRLENKINTLESNVNSLKNRIKELEKMKGKRKNSHQSKISNEGCFKEV